MTSQAIVADTLTKHFGDREAVSQLSFAVTRGSAFGLLGPNGSGKTTTIRLITGLLTPDGGSVTLFGEAVNAHTSDALRQRIGVQTDTNLYDTLSARENLRAWGALYGMDRRSLSTRVDEVLDTFGLLDRADSLAGEFSKGMRQKLAIARAILHEPELLFLDEPTAGLDPEAAAELIDYLKEMIHSHSTTVIISTHQLAGLETLCDDIGIINRGQLLTAGPVAELLAREWPGHRHLLHVSGDPDPARRIVASLASITSEAHDTSIAFQSAAADTVSEVVAALVHAGVSVRAVIPQQPTIEDLYFATLAEEAQA